MEDLQKFITIIVGIVFIGTLITFTYQSFSKTQLLINPAEFEQTVIGDEKDISSSLISACTSCLADKYTNKDCFLFHLSFNGTLNMSEFENMKVKDNINITEGLWKISNKDMLC